MSRLAVALFSFAFLAVPLGAGGQPAGRVHRIGFLAFSPPAPPLYGAFRRGLQDVGYVEGRDIVIEYRSADGHLAKLAGLAQELASLKVDLIVAANTPAALAAKRATTTIPVVFPASADAVGSGLVTSLARPGGNATGLSFLAPELIGKGLEVLKAAVPKATRVAVLWQPGAHGKRAQENMLRAAEDAGRALGIQLPLVEARSRDDLDKAFGDMARGGVEGVTVLTSIMFFDERKRLVELAVRNRLPVVYPWREPVDDGGLMAYGPSIPDLFRRAAIYVDKILRGARPADLPVEQPTKFEFVINLKAARALGLTISAAVLARADEVIE